MVISFHGQIVSNQIAPINSQIVPQNSQFVPPKSQFVAHICYIYFLHGQMLSKYRVVIGTWMKVLIFQNYLHNSEMYVNNFTIHCRMM